MGVRKTTKWKPVQSVNIDLCFKGSKYALGTEDENSSWAGPSWGHDEDPCSGPSWLQSQLGHHVGAAKILVLFQNCRV